MLGSQLLNHRGRDNSWRCCAGLRTLLQLGLLCNFVLPLLLLRLSLLPSLLLLNFLLLPPLLSLLPLPPLLSLLLPPLPLRLLLLPLLLRLPPLAV